MYHHANILIHFFPRKTSRLSIKLTVEVILTVPVGIEITTGNRRISVTTEKKMVEEKFNYWKKKQKKNQSKINTNQRKTFTENIVSSSDISRYLLHHDR